MLRVKISNVPNEVFLGRLCSCQFSVDEQLQLRKEQPSVSKAGSIFYSESLILAQNERWRRG